MNDKELTQQMLIRKLPDFRDSWSNETKLNWFKCFEFMWDLSTRIEVKHPAIQLESNDFGRFSFLEMDYGENITINSELICSQEYGYRKTTKCNKSARYVYTRTGQVYCGWHARKFNVAALRVIRREN